MKPLRTVVIGAGHLGFIHTRLLTTLDQVELVGVVDPRREARQRVERELGVPAAGDLEALPEPVEAAIIATPTGSHHQVALPLLRAGVHVLVEKPITSTIAEADELIRAAAEQRCVLQVGHVERFNAAWNAVAHELEEARYFEAVRAGTYTFRSTDVSIVLDLMIHDLDLILSAVRAPVVDVEAFGLALFGPHEDLAHARLRFANGCIADLKASRVSYEPCRTMHVFAPTAFAAIDFAAGAAELVQPDAAVRRREVDLTRCPPEQQPELRTRLFDDLLCRKQIDVQPVNAILEEQREFAHAIRHGTPVRVPGEEAREALAVAERILDSVARHRWDGTRSGPMGPHAVFDAAPRRHPKAA